MTCRNFLRQNLRQVLRRKLRRKQSGRNGIDPVQTVSRNPLKRNLVIRAWQALGNYPDLRA